MAHFLNLSEFDFGDLDYETFHADEEDPYDSSSLKTRRVVLIVIIVFAVISNLILLCCLAHTWKYWRQVKWYVIFLCAANWLEVFLSLSPYLHMTVEGHFGSGSDAACQAVACLGALGHNAATMAVGALSVHVLLTAITGNQGSALRHAFVMGLFVLFSLPVPISMIFVHKVISFGIVKKMYVCAENFDIMSMREYFYVGQSIAIAYFPVFVFLNCIIVAGILTIRGRDNKGDQSSSDLVVTGLVGIVLMVCAIPTYTLSLIAMENDAYFANTSNMQVFNGLQFLFFSRNFIAATVIVIFAYAHAFKTRGDGYIGGERQKLVP